MASSRVPGAGELSPGLVRLMAVTCGVTVANLYYGQPLLHSIAAALAAGYRLSYLVAAIVVALTLALALVLLRPRQARG